MKGTVIYDEGTREQMTIHFIRDKKCEEYMQKLTEINESLKMDLSRLKEDAFYNWKVVQQNKTSK